MNRFLNKVDWLETRLFETAVWATLLLATAAGVLAFLATAINAYDDAIPLVSARLAELGRVPAIDFISFYPPFYFYAVAEGFRLFVPSVLVPKFFAAILLVAVIAATTYLFRIAFPRLRRLTPFMALPAAIAASRLNSASWPGFSLALLSLLVYITAGYVSRRRELWLAAAGLIGGVSTLVRFNFGPYVFVVVVADILLNEFLSVPADPVQLRLKHALLQTALFGIPFLAANVAFYFAVYGHDAITVPLRIMAYSSQVMSSSRAFLPLRPDLRTLFSLLFPCGWIVTRKVIESNRLPGAAAIPLAAGAALAGLAIVSRGKPSISLWFPGLSFLVVVTLHVFVFRLPRAVLDLLLLFTCMQHYFLSRADFDHGAQFTAIAALTIPFLFVSTAGNNNDEQGRGWAPQGRILLALLALTYVVGEEVDFHRSIVLDRTAIRLLASGNLDSNVPDRRRLAFLDPGLADEIKATEFVRQKTGPSTRIFVGVREHSKPFTNDVRAYWLAERLPAVTYIHFDVASASGEQVQRNIIDQLQKTDTQWAILYDIGESMEGWFQKQAPGSKALDQFMASEFHAVARFGRYSVMMRNR